MRDEQNRYREHSVTTLGINPASLASHAKYAASFQFNFPLVSDPDRAAARAWQALKPDEVGVLRTVYLVGSDGTVLFGMRGAPSVDAILGPLS